MTIRKKPHPIRPLDDRPTPQQIADALKALKEKQEREAKADEKPAE